jgi:hypothetical protein
MMTQSSITYNTTTTYQLSIVMRTRSMGPASAVITEQRTRSSAESNQQQAELDSVVHYIPPTPGLLLPSVQPQALHVNKSRVPILPMISISRNSIQQLDSADHQSFLSPNISSTTRLPSNPYMNESSLYNLGFSRC